MTNQRFFRYFPLFKVRFLAGFLLCLWGSSALAAAVALSSSYWPNGVVPYRISSAAAADAAVHEDIINAIRHWQTRSVVQFVPRTSESVYVEFVLGSECESEVGRAGSAAQPITLKAGGACEFGGTVHAIGHALGYMHEHTRQDRDTYVTVLWSYIQPGAESYFDKYESGSGLDLNAYDYGSIMHPGTTEYSYFGYPTLIPNTAPFNAYKAIYGDTVLGQRDSLSVLDRLAADQMYNVCWSGSSSGSNYWQANPWRACSASCTDPGRTREVFCHATDGSCVSDSSCDAGTKPATTDSCAALLDCDFDSGNCGWDPVDTGDKMDWFESFTATPSGGTGPSADHTSGSGFYLFIETSIGASGDTAFLTSVPVDIASGTTLSFWYHFYGSTLGSLEVQVASCGGSWTTLHTISTANTTSENAWREATVALPAMSNAQIRFKATRGAGWNGDIGIDDISLSVSSGPPPKVMLVDSINNTGDNVVSEAELIDVSITQMLVTFDQDMANPPGNGGANDVTNPSNYLLYEDGVNDVFDTVDCAGGVVSDDAQKTVNSVSYNAATKTATLSVNGATGLGGGNYRLLACGTLENNSGDKLDGDGDGNGGDDLVRNFSILDFDDDGTPDGEDADDDNDGVDDVEDAFPLNPNEWLDTDGDGTGNNADTDDDNDGVLDTDDAFPLDASESVDTDGDGIGNNADPDDDNDGLSDDYEIANNLDPLDGSDCPFYICPNGLTSGWRLIPQISGP